MPCRCRCLPRICGHRKRFDLLTTPSDVEGLYPYALLITPEVFSEPLCVSFSFGNRNRIIFPVYESCSGTGLTTSSVTRQARLVNPLGPPLSALISTASASCEAVNTSVKAPRAEMESASGGGLDGTFPALARLSHRARILERRRAVHARRMAAKPVMLSPPYGGRSISALHVRMSLC